MFCNIVTAHQISFAFVEAVANSQKSDWIEALFQRELYISLLAVLLDLLHHLDGW